jgi:hypothetical protein
MQRQQYWKVLYNNVGASQHHLCSNLFNPTRQHVPGSNLAAMHSFPARPHVAGDNNATMHSFPAGPQGRQSIAYFVTLLQVVFPNKEVKVITKQEFTTER